MKLPDFEEFIASIPEEQLNYIKEGTLNELINSSYNTSELIGKSYVCSIKACLALISLYHQWLQDHID